MAALVSYFFSFLLGAIIGSFLNVCICRIPARVSILSPPSHCPKCNARLSAADLIPILSYSLLRGKCRYCGVSVSWQYPVVEFISGVLFLAAFWRFGLSLQFWGAVVLFSLLVIASFIDIRHRIIPDRIVLTGLILGLPLNLVSWGKAYSAFTGFLLGGGLLLLVALLSKGGMGGGDIKLAAVAGIYLGWQNTLLMLFLAFLIGSIFGVAVVWVQRKTLKEAIPFGPFLFLGAVLAMLFGNEIISWYWNLFR